MHRSRIRDMAIDCATEDLGPVTGSRAAVFGVSGTGDGDKTYAMLADCLRGGFSGEAGAWVAP
ncbi:MAG: hypothetical protein AAGF76_08105 [Pseudomonadota bacterium]